MYACYLIAMFMQVVLPTGGILKVDYGWSTYMNVYFTPAAVDYGRTEGI